MWGLEDPVSVIIVGYKYTECLVVGWRDLFYLVTLDEIVM